MKYPWDVWIANVRYEDQPEISVPRPVVIIDSDGCLTLSIKGTSQNPRDNWAGEYALHYWHEAGLKKPTVIRCSKLLYLNEKDFTYKLGTLHPTDIVNIKIILERMYDAAL